MYLKTFSNCHFNEVNFTYKVLNWSFEFIVKTIHLKNAEAQ